MLLMIAPHCAFSSDRVRSKCRWAGSTGAVSVGNVRSVRCAMQ